MDVFCAVQGIAFSWDARKAEANLTKHRVSFAEACEAFLDPFLHSLPAQAVGSEVRQAAFGLTAGWRLLHVTFVFHDDHIRIISARLATPLQRKRYEDGSAP